MVGAAWCAVWCAAMLVGAEAVPAQLALDSRDTQHIDDEALNWMSSGSGGGGGLALWRETFDPGLYLVGEPSDFLRNESARLKRKMPSLSISNPMDMLRERLKLEIMRKQIREKAERQAQENRLFLQNVGKRGMWAEDSLNRREDN